MSEIIRSSIISFIAGVVLTYVYLTNTTSSLINLYIYGLCLSISLTIITMVIATKKTQIKNIAYNNKLKEGSNNYKDTSVVQIIKKRITIIPLVLLIFGSWISGFYLLYLMTEVFLNKDN